jgi:aryl-alcohol dehydrogenase-like predicted oxidoreductase
MDARAVGTSSLKVSIIGLGCNNFGIRTDDATSLEVIGAALDAGITHFDTAHNYGYGRSESILGRALHASREDVVIATKFGGEAEQDPAFQGASRRSILRSCEDSLRRLQTDHIDLYYLHLPDPATPIDETLGALALLIDQGKVRYAGCSHLNGAEIDAALQTAAQRDLPPFVASQSEWNLLHRSIEADVVPVCRRHGLGVIPYFPLASGMLTGKYQQGQPFPAGTRLAGSEYFQHEANEQAFRKVERLSEFARRSGRSLAELALSWLATQPEVASVIAGATHPAQVAENVKATHSQLRPDELATIDDILSAEGGRDGTQD